jgi:hypothetical protein
VQNQELRRQVGIFGKQEELRMQGEASAIEQVIEELVTQGR